MYVHTRVHQPFFFYIHTNMQPKLFSHLLFVCLFLRISCNRQTEYFVNKMSRTVSHPTSVTLQFQQQHSNSTISPCILAGCAIRAPPTHIKGNTHAYTMAAQKRQPVAILIRKSRNITLCLHCFVFVVFVVLFFYFC